MLNLMKNKIGKIGLGYFLFSETKLTVLGKPTSSFIKEKLFILRFLD